MLNLKKKFDLTTNILETKETLSIETWCTSSFGSSLD